MAFSKNELFSNEHQRCSELFKALGHPARLAILDYLSKTKTCITGDIAEVLPLSRTTVNQHLKELKDVGLIKGTTEGAKTCYCLDNDKVKELKSMSVNFFNEISVNTNYYCG